jgi:hypothetical protein
VAQRLEAGDGHAELFARVHVIEGDRHQPVHQPDAFGAVRGDGDVDGGFQRRPAVGTDQRSRCVRERHVGGPGAVLGRVAAHGGGGRFDDEQADAGVVVIGTAQARRHDESIGFVAGRHHMLAAAQAPALGGGHGPGRDLVQAVARAMLLVSEHDQRFGRDDARQPLGLQRFGRRGQQCRGDQRPGREWRVDEATPELLADDHCLDRAEAQSAMRFRHGQAGQAEVGQFGVDRPCRAASLGQCVPTLEAETLFHPACHGVAQGLLVVGEVEVHGDVP